MKTEKPLAQVGGFLFKKKQMCNNTLSIDTANVNVFGFTTTFKPYDKSVVFDISELTTFKSGGQANIDNIVFTVTTPIGDEKSVTIDPSDSEETGTISTLSQGALFFGTYHIKAVLEEADNTPYTIEFDVNVCGDDRMTAKNFIQGCLDLDVDCGRAVIEIYDKSNLKFAGKSPETELTTWDGSIIYPKNYEEQVDFTFVPYSLNIAESITGLYQVSLVTKAKYDLDCGVTLEVQFISEVNKNVQCGASMCELNCCWSDALAIVQEGGTKGAQMKEKLQLASYYFNSAVAAWSCGKDNEDDIAMVKKILDCDCKCQKSLVIQPRPITYGAANLNGSCGTTITEDENGDYQFHSFVYTLANDPTTGEDKFTFRTVQVSECEKRTYITLDCEKIERCIYNILASSDNIDILNQWRNLFGVGCDCDEVSLSSHIESVSSVATDIEANKLEDYYFVRNETLQEIVYNVGATVSGGVIDSIQYHDQMVGNAAQKANGTLGDITIPCNVCAESVIDVENRDLLVNIHTECGCVLQTDTPIIVNKVPYSERYDFSYRFNPQIDDAPYIEYTEYDESGEAYTIREVIYAESLYNSLAESDGSVVRALKLKTDSGGATSFVEVRTLFGRSKAGSSPLTYNNVWGNQAEFDYASSVVLDHSEIVNGYPTLYLVTFGGVVCRAVRERDNQCDERANWKVYIINGSNGGNDMYGIKKWKVDANNNQTFLIFDNDDQAIKLLNYDGTGSKNSASNWVLTTLITGLNGQNANFNVDGNVIYALIQNQIKYYRYTGTTALASLQTASNYTTTSHNLTSGGAVVPNSYADGAGNVATVDNPMALWKEGSTFYFCNSRMSAIGSTTDARGSYIRAFEPTTDSPAGPSDYLFSTEIVVNTNSNVIAGTWVGGTSSNISGETMGMCYIPDLGWLSMYQYGVRIFDFTAKTCTLLTGQAGAGQNLNTDGEIMDSQWSYLTT